MRELFMWPLLAMLAIVPAFGFSGEILEVGQAGTDKSTAAPAGTSSRGTAEAKAGQSAAPAGQPPVEAVVLMLVPFAAAANENAMKSGCWAKIYSGKNYTGDTLTLTGPVSIADMDGPFGLNWDDKVDSVELGPNATLTVYDNEAYRDQVAQFKPGQRVPDVSKPLGYFDEFASVRMSCGKP